MAAVPVQADHRLQVVALNDDVAGLLLGVADAVLGESAADAWADAAGKLAGDVLAGELDPDAGLTRLYEFNELLTGQSVSGRNMAASLRSTDDNLRPLT